MTLQELSFKDNNCHVYQTEVWTTIIPEFNKTKDYSTQLLFRTTFQMWTRQIVRVYLYTWIVVLFL